MKYKLPEHVSLTDVDNNAVILDLEAGHYFGLNHVGNYFLHLLTQNIDHELAITEIAKKFSTDVEQVNSDINALIEQLIEKKLLHCIGE